MIAGEFICCSRPNDAGDRPAYDMRGDVRKVSLLPPEGDSLELWDPDGDSYATLMQPDRVPRRGVALAVAVPSGQSRGWISLRLAG